MTSSLPPDSFRALHPEPPPGQRGPEGTDPAGALFAAAGAQIRKVIVGQEALIEQALAALLAGGHVLIEGVPGTAKTLLVRTIARVFALSFKRIQLTPDLMPSDITGTNIFDLRTQTFVFRPGPIFGQLILADEINRAPAKTQSALLEAMQERQVTVDGVSHPLPALFTVVATQNPVEQEGTYPLPEAQLDRFMLKLVVSYPDEKNETEILRLHQRGLRAEDLECFDLRVVAGEHDMQQAQASIRERAVRDDLLGYLARLVRATRSNLRVEVGAGPRAGLMLLMAAKARAALQGRGHVLPDDIKAMARPALRHRLTLRPGATVDGYTVEDVLEEVLAQVEVPR